MLTGESMPVKKGSATPSSARPSTRAAASATRPPRSAPTPRWRRSSSWCRRRRTPRRRRSCSPTRPSQWLVLAAIVIGLLTFAVWFWVDRPAAALRPHADHHGLRHRLPGRARPGHADGDHGRHRPGRDERHPVQERRRARERHQARRHHLRQDRHAHRGPARRRGDRDGAAASPRTRCCRRRGVEKFSEHPLAQAIAQAGRRPARRRRRPASPTSTGRARAPRSAADTVLLGNRKLMDDAEARRSGALAAEAARASQGGGRTVVHVARGRHA